MVDRSEPTFFVLVREEGSNEDTRVDYSSEILSFEYQDDEAKADLVKLKVRNWALSNFDNPIWRPGNVITCSWGYVGNMTQPHEATITKVAGSTELSVEAQGGESGMNREVRTRAWEGMTRSAVVRQIAIEHGFSWDDTQWIEDTEVEEEVITQARETDAQLLRRLAAIEGYEFFIDVDGFHFHQRQLGQKPIKEVRWYLPGREGVRGGVGDVISWSVTNDVFGKPQAKTGKITVKTRHPETKEPIEVVASEIETARDRVGGAVSQVVSFATGSSTRQKNTAKEDTRPTTQTNRKAVKREANGAYRKAQGSTVEMSMKLVGDPHVHAKTIIAVSGISKRLAGNYYIKSARHVVGSGYITELKLTSDGVEGFPDEQAARADALEQAQAESAAKLNQETAEGADPNALTVVEEIDPATGEVVVKYYDSRGWEVNPGS
jgi:phage protein D